MYLARLSYTNPLPSTPSKANNTQYRRPDQGAEEAARVSLKGLDFTNRLERHISDYRSGKGYLSTPIGEELIEKEGNAATILSERSPKALSSFSGYLSGMSYSQRARFVKGVDEMASSLKNFKI